MSPRPYSFIRYFVAWMLLSLIALTLLDSIELELFFVVSLIGFLVVTELMTPINIRPEWHRRLRWVIALGLVVFGYIVTRRILEILPYELSVTL
jgi:hypothetical protein